MSILRNWFVSRKKYDELQEIALKAQDNLVEDQKVISYLRAELDKQVAVNEELKSFSDKFKEFYQKVTSIPVITNQLGPAVGLTVSAYIDERYSGYGHMAESLKAQLTSDLVERITQYGAVKFELIDDRATGRAAYKATIYVHTGG